MTREVYADKAFIEFSRNQVFIRLFVDTDSQGARLARKFDVRGFPTLIVLDGTGVRSFGRSSERTKTEG